MDASLPRLTRLGNLLSEWEADAIAAHDARVNGTARGPITGLARLDQELGGALQPGPHFITGGPGIGKTALASQIAASSGCPALYVSAEMGLLELFRRHTARATSTLLGRLKTGELPVVDSLNLARRAAAATPLLSIADATRAPASLSWLLQAAEAARGGSEHFLIVIDSVHSWAEGLGGEASEYEVLNFAIQTIRRLASELACPIVGIAERNRASMKEGGLSSSAGTRKFEYGAESVLDLNRKKDGPPDAAGEVDVTLRVEKNRNGAIGRPIDLKFHGGLQRFREA